MIAAPVKNVPLLYRVLAGYQESNFESVDEANDFARRAAGERPGLDVKVYRLERVYRAPRPERIVPICYEVE